ncbi:hypothetical protein PRK78_001055 [Emydomyces testavorans]|uniref:Zn(2)-C6 fungal-type domain-containing protein n=1 Tax=Emydomyces testavorans TaxID=2070801 RepID=A0AAF0DCL2_9EURO|nr:hypothetical protein PRK78_001055 [Emydomyces testavorans]
MSTVAAATMASGNHEAARDTSVEQSPSRFTAVNGRDLVLLNGASDTHIPPNRSHERGNSTEGRRESEHQKILPAQKDLPSVNVAGRVHHDQMARRKNSDTRSASLNRNKRKRADSDDRQVSPSTSIHTQSAPRSPSFRADDNITQPAYSVDTNGMTRPTITPESDAGVKSLRRQYTPTERPEEIDPNSHRRPWDRHDSQPASHSGQLTQPMDASDVQMAETLQRDMRGNDGASRGWESVPNEAQNEIVGANLSQLAAHVQNQAAIQDKSRNQVQAETHTPSQSQTQGQAQSPASSGTQSGPKRKRVFSNRTKTGCMTCRRRKKKCDEQHPACNNCIRGNFPCEGYSVRSTWQKPSNPKGPVPLQSKGSFPEVAHPYTHEMSPQRHDGRVAGTILPDGGKTRPVPADEADRVATQYISSPPSTNSRGSWAKSSWSTQGPTAYLPDGPPKPEFRDSSGLKDVSRTDQAKSDYPIVQASCELTHGAHTKPAIVAFQSSMEQRPGAPRIDAASYSAQARMALNMEQHLAFESPAKNEKEKMLSGEQYRPFDPQLIKDRERCKAALWRFNNAGNPIHGISSTERTRLLKELLMPAAEDPSETIASRPVGSLGPGAVVEAPFNCHYGYNINIGEDVLISENCFFADDCTITVGAHTWIGPNVTILSSMAIGSMQERKGSQSRYQGRPVVIAEDCWVGAGCTILPGVTLGRGAYIAPGEIVRSQILPYGFQGLKPNYP